MKHCSLDRFAYGRAGGVIVFRMDEITQVVMRGCVSFTEPKLGSLIARPVVLGPPARLTACDAVAWFVRAHPAELSANEPESGGGGDDRRSDRNVSRV